jgi:two-component system, chemotaxis family, chemotaxis protein CheY
MAQTPSVLIIEDNADVRRSFADLLELDGWLVVQASNGIQALRALEDGLEPAVILLDLELPFMSGWHLQRHLRSNAAFSLIPVVIVTAHEVASAGIDGARAVLQKPMEPRSLLNTLRACINGVQPCP